MAGTKESHHLVAHGIKRQGSLPRSFQLHIILDEESNDIFVLGIRLLVLLAYNVVRLTNYYVAALKYITIHLRGQILGLWNEGGEPMQQAGADIESEDEAIGFTDRGVGVPKGVKVGAEASFSDYIQGGPVQPLENFDCFGASLLHQHVSLPEVGQEQRFPPEDGCQGLDRLG